MKNYESPNPDSAEPWCEEVGRYDRSDGTYVQFRATETGATFAISEKTGFSFIDDAVDSSEAQNQE